MGKINDGGAAFPCDRSEFFDRNEGMTLRDYFAAKVMASTMAVPEYLQAAAEKRKNFEEILQSFARDAYLAADAMLAERDK